MNIYFAVILLSLSSVIQLKCQNIRLWKINDLVFYIIDTNTVIFTVFNNYIEYKILHYVKMYPGAFLLLDMADASCTIIHHNTHSKQFKHNKTIPQHSAGSNAQERRWDLRQYLKTFRVGACLIWSGSLFQRFGAANAKAKAQLSLRLYLVFGTIKTNWPDDLKDLKGLFTCKINHKLTINKWCQPI